MNRKIKFTLSALMLSTIIFACAPATTTADTEATATTTEDARKTTDLSIAYINNDTLITYYNLFIDLRGDYETKATKIQTELQNKSRALERKMVSAQEKVEKGLVTRSEAMQLEQSLQTEQQSLITYRDKVLAELAEEEQVMSNKLRNAIDTYIAKYNETAKYDLILNQNAATNVIMLGNPDLDITQDIIKGLNAEYLPSAK
ncbi:MAG: OmpH family outer membrane protein [Rikenellaceae bacterium]